MAGAFPTPPTEGETGALANWSALNTMEFAYRGYLPSSFAPAGATGGGFTSHLYAGDAPFGLGVTATTPTTVAAALRAFFLACGAAFTPTGADRASSGVVGELPVGTWIAEPPGANNYGPLFPIIGPANANNGGAIWIVGQGSGATTLTMPGNIGHALTLATATRGANHDSSGDNNFSGNTITLGFTSDHHAVVGQMIALHVMSRGRPMWAHYSIIAIPDSTHIQYCAADLDDGTGHTKTTGGDLDLMIPPLSYTPAPFQTAVGNIVYFCEYMVEPLNFKQPHAIFFDRLTLQAGSSSGTPLDGLGIRVSNRCHLGEDCAVSGFWLGTVITGVPHIHPDLPAAARVPQNSDHSWIESKNLSSNWAHVAFIDNSSNSYFRKTGMPGLGGGRDNHLHSNLGQVTGPYSIICNDAGNFETFDWIGTNIKGGAAPIMFEGVDGVDPIETMGIDAMQGWAKLEGLGSWSFAFDETKRRIFQKPIDVQIRMEAGLSINGGDQGTPGGGGSVPSGSFNDFTEKPWPAVTVSLTNVGGMPTLTATVPAAMFGSDGGCDIGTVVAIGLAYRSSGMGAPYAADGVTVVGGAGAGKFQSATAAFTTDDVGLRIDSPNVNGGSDTIAARNSATEVLMTKAITVASTAQAWMVKNDGTKTQSGVCHESRVQTVTAPALGLVTITMPYPTYDIATLPALPGPYNAQVGDIGHVRCRELRSWDVPILWDTQAIDKLCRAHQWIDIMTLGPGGISLIQDLAPTTRRTLPSIRVWDSIVRSGADGVITGATTLTVPTGRFCPLDTGKVITGSGIAGTTTTVTYQSPTVVTLSAASTNGATSWLLRAVKAKDPMRFEIRRGQNRFYLYAHDPGDANAIPQGGYVEFSTSAGNNQTIIRSTANRLALAAGIAMQASPANAVASVTTNCDAGVVFSPAAIGAGTARVRYNGAVVMVAQYPTVLSLLDDQNQALSTASTAVAAGVLIIDNGDGTMKAVAGSPPTAGQRVVGQSIQSAASAASGSPLAIVLAAPYWTA